MLSNAGDAMWCGDNMHEYACSLSRKFEANVGARNSSSSPANSSNHDLKIAPFPKRHV